MLYQKALDALQELTAVAQEKTGHRRHFQALFARESLDFGSFRCCAMAFFW